jgi:myo-inositol-1(or 4)-monophosphatase
MSLSKSDLALALKSALAAARAAGKIQANFFRKAIRVDEKKGAGLVTEVDLKSEEIILKRLRRDFPSFAIIGEESGASAGSSGPTKSDTPTWHVDPLDGTTNYAHGFPMYGVSIGLAVGEHPLLGVILAPSLGECWSAARGQGAFRNGEAIRVSPRKRLPDCLLSTGFAYMRDKALQDALGRFRRASLEARAVRRPGAAALDLAYVAMGVFDGFWERNLNSWDVCAGIALVEEAGGKISDYEFKPFSFAAREILASNGTIHKSLTELLRKA